MTTQWYWKPGQVYVATALTFVLGLGAGIPTGLLIADVRDGHKVEQVQQQKQDLLGRVTDLEGELSAARRAADEVSR